MGKLRLPHRSPTMRLCDVVVQPVLSGPVTLLWGLASIFLVSFLAARAARAAARLPKWISGLSFAPAIAWHEICHAVVCVLVGHRIEEIRLRGDPGTGAPAHVTYRYNPNNPLQVLGASLSGWAPVLISGSLLVWGVPHIAMLGTVGQGLACYAVILLALSMPLSWADWRAALFHLWLILPIAMVVGFFAYPAGMNACAPWVFLQIPVILVTLVLTGIWVLFVTARRLWR